MGRVALGNEIHMCVGQMLARMEGEIALSALVERMELAGSATRRINNNLRSLKADRSV